MKVLHHLILRIFQNTKMSEQDEEVLIQRFEDASISDQGQDINTRWTSGERELQLCRQAIKKYTKLRQKEEHTTKETSKDQDQSFKLTTTYIYINKDDDETTMRKKVEKWVEINDRNQESLIIQETVNKMIDLEEELIYILQDTPIIEIACLKHRKEIGSKQDTFCRKCLKRIQRRMTKLKILLMTADEINDYSDEQIRVVVDQIFYKALGESAMKRVESVNEIKTLTKSGQDLFTHQQQQQQQQQQQPLEEKESTLDKPIIQTREEIKKPIRKSKLKAIQFITGLCQTIKLEEKIEQKEKYQQNKLKKGTTKIIKRAVRSKKKAKAKTSKMLSWIQNTRTNIDENHNRRTYIPIIQS